jgi:predicted aspartyl protease
MAVKIKLELLTIETDGCHILAKAKIYNHKLRLVVDTGASKTTFDKGWIEENLPDLYLEQLDTASAGLGTNEMISAVTVLPELKMGKLKLKYWQVAVLDLSHVRQVYQSMNYGDIQGVLGGDVLLAVKGKIDYGKLTIKCDEL